MNPPAQAPRPEEIELKLALPTSDPQDLARRLARVPVLARCTATHRQLHNIYYDTPRQDLYEERVALRLRRVGTGAHPEWLQTLKMGGRSDSALSHRGEWEVPAPSAGLTRDALEATPWPEFDPDGSVFDALVPCLVTAFERTSWPVRKRGGSVVEVSLDIGQIVAGDKSAPVCELELELLAGHPAALFEVAQQIARSLAALPLNISKSERGYALLLGSASAPLRAKPPVLTSRMSVPVAAQSVLREMFCQFTTNLNLLRSSDDPEVLHQARVGWRRFKSAVRLFKPELAADTIPSWQALEPLLTFVGELRDFDVARFETLPRFADAYTAASAQREGKWQELLAAMNDAAALRRRSICHALEVPAVGSTLLAMTQWLEVLPAQNSPGELGAGQKNALRHWARDRIAHLHKKMEQALEDTAHPESLHRARLLAKRLRYGIEALRPVLRKRQAGRWLQQATRLQTGIGLTRDVHQAGVLASQMETDTGLAEFLRGLAIGQGAQR